MAKKQPAPQGQGSKAPATKPAATKAPAPTTKASTKAPAAKAPAPATKAPAPAAKAPAPATKAPAAAKAPAPAAKAPAARPPAATTAAPPATKPASAPPQRPTRPAAPAATTQPAQRPVRPAATPSAPAAAAAPPRRSRPVDGPPASAPVTNNRPAGATTAAPSGVLATGGRSGGATVSEGTRRPVVRQRTGRRGDDAPLPTGSSGDHLFKRGPDYPRIRTFRPTYDSRQRLTFRMFPTWNVDAANEGRFEVEPYRYSQATDNFSDILRRYPAAYFVGGQGAAGKKRDNSATFFLWDYAWKEQYDQSVNPCVLLMTGMYDAVYRDYSHLEWTPLLKSKDLCPFDTSMFRDNRSPRPTVLGITSGMVLQDGKDILLGDGKRPYGLSPDDNTPIILLKNSACFRLYDILNQTVEGYTGDPNDFAQSMACGDPVAFDQGCFFSVFRGSHTDQADTIRADKITGFGDAPSQTARGGDDGRDQQDNAYQVIATRHPVLHNGTELSGVSARLDHPAWVGEAVRNRMVFFDDIIDLPLDPSPEAIREMHHKQCVLLARAFKHLRSVVEFCWQSRPEYLNDSDVRAILLNATQVQIPGSVPKQRDPADPYGVDPYGADPSRSAGVADDLLQQELALSADLDRQAASEYAGEEYEEAGEEAGEEQYEEPGEEQYEEAGEEAGYEEYEEAGEEQYEEAGEEAGEEQYEEAGYEEYEEAGEEQPGEEQPGEEEYEQPGEEEYEEAGEEQYEEQPGEEEYEEAGPEDWVEEPAEGDPVEGEPAAEETEAALAAARRRSSRRG